MRAGTISVLRTVKGPDTSPSLLENACCFENRCKKFKTTKKWVTFLKMRKDKCWKIFYCSFLGTCQGGGWGSGCPPENKRGVEQKGFPYIPEVPPPPHVQRDKWEGEGERKHRKQISHDSSPPMTRTDPSSNERTTVFVDR